ncbi:class I SAM-dependent methyltransferase [Rhodanobacter sp. Root627]|uniref:class I SAM-dependent methyltransferase n=1 Tax=Rhodanobacter sp. Root627 TaxID=1736572 RepID=UPI000B1CE8B8|nr:class I SAM-dependent methyltransferase [Rhodanobacter sp. Root627]
MATSQFNPIEYWEHRHRELKDDHRNVGNRGLTSAQNFRMLCNKALRIARELGALNLPHGSSVLDAGCGAGVVANLLADADFDVTGIDCSSTALESARIDSKASFERGELDSFDMGRVYDAVLCLDVLYHVVTDEEWRNSLRNLARHMKFQGHLLIIEYFEKGTQKSADYVCWRSAAQYADVFQTLGLTLVDMRDFLYPATKFNKTLLVVRRAGAAALSG